LAISAHLTDGAVKVTTDGDELPVPAKEFDIFGFSVGLRKLGLDFRQPRTAQVGRCKVSASRLLVLIRPRVRAQVVSCSRP
jgi:hypothetical protein